MSIKPAQSKTYHQKLSSLKELPALEDEIDSPLMPVTKKEKETEKNVSEETESETEATPPASTLTNKKCATLKEEKTEYQFIPAEKSLLNKFKFARRNHVYEI